MMTVAPTTKSVRMPLACLVCLEEFGNSLVDIQLCEAEAHAVCQPCFVNAIMQAVRANPCHLPISCFGRKNEDHRVRCSHSVSDSLLRSVLNCEQLVEYDKASLLAATQHVSPQQVFLWTPCCRRPFEIDRRDCRIILRILPCPYGCHASMCTGCDRQLTFAEQSQVEMAQIVTSAKESHPTVNSMSPVVTVTSTTKTRLVELFQMYESDTDMSSFFASSSATSSSTSSSSASSSSQKSVRSRVTKYNHDVVIGLIRSTSWPRATHLQAFGKRIALATSNRNEFADALQHFLVDVDERLQSKRAIRTSSSSNLPYYRRQHFQRQINAYLGTADLTRFIKTKQDQVDLDDLDDLDEDDLVWLWADIQLSEKPDSDDENENASVEARAQNDPPNVMPGVYWWRGPTPVRQPWSTQTWIDRDEALHADHADFGINLSTQTWIDRDEALHADHADFGINLWRGVRHDQRSGEIHDHLGPLCFRPALHEVLEDDSVLGDEGVCLSDEQLHRLFRRTLDAWTPQCPGCRRLGLKSGSECNVISCHCGVEWCFMCSKQIFHTVRDYLHAQQTKPDQTAFMLIAKQQEYSASSSVSSWDRYATIRRLHPITPDHDSSLSLSSINHHAQFSTAPLEHCHDPMIPGKRNTLCPSMLEQLAITYNIDTFVQARKQYYVSAQSQDGVFGFINNDNHVKDGIEMRMTAPFLAIRALCGLRQLQSRLKNDVFLRGLRLFPEWANDGWVCSQLSVPCVVSSLASSSSSSSSATLASATGKLKPIAGVTTFHLPFHLRSIWGRQYTTIVDFFAEFDDIVDERIRGYPFGRTRPIATGVLRDVTSKQHHPPAVGKRQTVPFRQGSQSRALHEAMFDEPGKTKRDMKRKKPKGGRG